MIEYFQILADDYENFTTIVPWLMAYLLIQFESLSSFLIVHLIAYLIIVHLTDLTFDFTQSWCIVCEATYVIPNIIIANVFRHRPDRHLLAVLVYKASISVLTDIEKRIGYFDQQNDIDLVNNGNELFPIGGDDGLDPIDDDND